MDLNVNKWNKREVDEYVSAMLLKIEIQEKELLQKETRLKEMETSTPICVFSQSESDPGVITKPTCSNENIENKVFKRKGKLCEINPSEALNDWVKWCSRDEKPVLQKDFGIDGKKYEEKRKHLAEIRKADYNDYLKMKENDNYKKTSCDQLLSSKLSVCRYQEQNAGRKLYPASSLIDCKSDLFLNVSPSCSLQSYPIKNPEITYNYTESLSGVESFGRKRSSLAFPLSPSSEIHNEIAKLYKQQLDKQIDDKQKLKLLQNSDEVLHEVKNMHQANCYNISISEEHLKELKRINKLKKTFELQEERCKKLEEFIEKDKEEKKKKFKKHCQRNKENSQKIVYDNIKRNKNSEKTCQDPFSKVLVNLSEVRKQAFNTQNIMDQEILKKL